MPRQGLRRERVVEAAVALIEERGAERFSMGELAKRLCVKPASLYNHVESLDALLEAVGFQADVHGAGGEQAIAGQEATRLYSRWRRRTARLPGSTTRCTG